MFGCPRFHPSAVELRCRLRMKSRTPDCAYRTARPILMKRGPVPLSRALASHDDETPSSFATCAGCSRGSISLVLAGGLMAPLPSCLGIDRRCLPGVREKSALLRQNPLLTPGKSAAVSSLSDAAAAPPASPST